MCLCACLSSLTGIQVGEWPPLGNVSTPAFWDAVYKVLLSQRWTIATTIYAPVGYAIADGDGPRGVRHSVVVLDGQIVHDPHPSRAGLIGKPIYYYVPLRAASCGESNGE
jgi:hypothetical protein